MRLGSRCRARVAGRERCRQGVHWARCASSMPGRPGGALADTSFVPSEPARPRQPRIAVGGGPRTDRPRPGAGLGAARPRRRADGCYDWRVTGGVRKLPRDVQL